MGDRSVVFEERGPAVVLRPLDSPRARLRALDVVPRAAVRSTATRTYAPPTSLHELPGSCDGCFHAQGSARELDGQPGRREMSLDWTGARVDGGPRSVPVGLPFQLEDVGVAEGHLVDVLDESGVGREGAGKAARLFPG